MAIADIEKLVADLIPSALSTISNLLGVRVTVSNKSPIDEVPNQVYGVYAGDIKPVTVPSPEEREITVILTAGYSFASADAVARGDFVASYLYVEPSVTVNVGEIITVKREKLINMVRDEVGGGVSTDPLPLPKDIATRVFQDTTNYIEGTDYNLTGYNLPGKNNGSIDWISGGNNPVQGSTYTINFNTIRKYEITHPDSLGMTRTIVNRYKISCLGD